MQKYNLLLKDLYFPILCFIIGIFLAFFIGGIKATIIIIILNLLEISLSFDNAVLNAAILNTMTPIWRQRFLTWGIFIAVFVMRLLFPILIIAIFSKTNLIEAFYFAFNNAEASKELLSQSHIPISAFGGMFLLMVFLDFILNTNKKIHWLVKLETFCSNIARFTLLRVLSALVILIIFTMFNKENAKHLLIFGSIGILLQVIIISFIRYLNKKFTQIPTQALTKSSALSFLYLEVLDASFSLDGVLGAFAITKDIILIFIGLGVGAIFVRSLTTILVKQEVLQKYQYLEHAAHYAIGALGLFMLLSTKIHINEIIPCFISVVLIVMALVSSK